MVEQDTLNVEVIGSSPIAGTTNKVGLRCQKVRNVLFAPSTRYKIDSMRGSRPNRFKETPFRKRFLLNVPLPKGEKDTA